MEPLSKFWLLELNSRCKGPLCPLSPDLELWKMLELPVWGLESWSRYSSLIWWNPDPKFGFSDLKGAKNLQVLHVLIWGFGECWRVMIRVWWKFRLGSWSWTEPCSKFWLLNQLEKCKEPPCALSPIFALNDTGDFHLGIWFLFMIWI